MSNSPYLSQPLRSEESAREQRHISMMEVIRRAAEYERRSMSDDQLANERDAQTQLALFLEDARSRIRRINAYSTVVQINMDEWDAFVHDSLPNTKLWDEKISEARRP